MITLSPIAALHADGRGQGDVRISGTITTVTQHTNAARSHSAVATLTDHTGSIDLHIYPRTWPDVHHLLTVDTHVSVNGLLYQADGKLSVICTNLTEEQQ